MFRLIHNARRATRRVFRRAGTKKSGHTFDFLGCTPDEFFAHLEKQFKPGMTRENQGSVWHIDHIRPVASFNLHDPDELKACLHHSNLQPLFAEENLSKGSFWNGKHW
jgi:hypothetical protein